MKGIQISSELEIKFLIAAKTAGVKVEKKFKTAIPGKVVYQVVAPFFAE